MPAQAMPVKLIVVIVLLSSNVLLDLSSLSAESGGGVAYVRIALNIGLLYGLLRGQEWARLLAKVTAILGLLSAALLLIPLLALGGAAFLAPSLAMFAYTAIGLAIVYGVFLLWTMNQVDVQQWLAARNLRN